MEKRYRIRKSSDYTKGYKKGKKFFNRDLTLIVLNNGLENPRIGFTLSKRFGKANKRNKMRRRLKEISRTEIDRFLPGKDYIFIPKSHTLGLDYMYLTKTVLHIVEKSKKVKKNE